MMKVFQKRKSNTATELSQTVDSLNPQRLVTARIIDELYRKGDILSGGKQGSEALYGSRRALFPNLSFNLIDGKEAAIALTRRYLSTYGPATAADVAHFFGARKKPAEEWIEALKPELTPVKCQDRKGLFALSKDLPEMKQPPPSDAEWPMRVLGLYDSFVLAHADKSWLIPQDSDKPAIFQKAAIVKGGVLHRGRLVCAVGLSGKGNKLSVELHEMEGWVDKLRPAVDSELQRITDAWGLKRFEVAKT
mmetsp:Transcript_39561/g.61714  ORF Transcript_39561/g.61714 Transcript_39561/m.61714 type:complete len:249 (-) Transcript_39561:1240-1986(-)